MSDLVPQRSAVRPAMRSCRAAKRCSAIPALASLLLALSCDSGPSGGEQACGPVMFGQPGEHTGLDASMCRPSCGCGADAFQPEAWTAARLAALQSWVLLDAPAALSADPYAAPAPAPAPDGTVCAVVVVDQAVRSYRLATFATQSVAEAAGGIVTHFDACGLCSPLSDLAVYASELDLTTPVRQCGLDTLDAPIEDNVACLEQLGFTHPCAQIWAYNTRHTRAECLGPCLALLNAPYHEPDGTLNECLRCDEEKSGPVFKAVAGRTRRNTGIASALCRSCTEVHPIAHDYP